MAFFSHTYSCHLLGISQHSEECFQVRKVSYFHCWAQLGQCPHWPLWGSWIQFCLLAVFHQRPGAECPEKLEPHRSPHCGQLSQVSFTSSAQPGVYQFLSSTPTPSSITGPGTPSPVPRKSAHLDVLFSLVLRKESSLAHWYSSERMAVDHSAFDRVCAFLVGTGLNVYPL